jgi:hypothetical protein
MKPAKICPIKTRKATGSYEALLPIDVFGKPGTTVVGALHTVTLALYGLKGGSLKENRG